jgi:hypothetical protein
MDLSTAAAERVKAELVLANDPDADRLAVMVRDGQGVLRMLTGNEVGVLLGHYTLTQGTKRARPYVATTIVSSVQLGQIAHDLGAAYDEVLTGFKWIANRALEREHSESVQFLFGYEEDVPPALAEAMIARYLAARPDLEPEAFRTAYAVLGAQRNAKILGLFTRLARRDGKRAYLDLLPRVRRHLQRDLAHPVLTPLRAWFTENLPLEPGAAGPATSAPPPR